MGVAAVVLAAGASSRLGSPKQLAMLGGETLLERAVRVAREAGCSPVVVVLGASAYVIQARCKLGDSIVVLNKDWVEGMGASVRVGVGVLGEVDGCVVMTCDMPAVTVAHLRALMVSGEVMASSYAGRRGVPAYLPVSTFPELLTLRGDAGARELLQAARTQELVGGEMDVDTADDLQRVRELFHLASDVS
jgi:molybdenum cofactor cytidylyltransferase